VSTTEEVIPHYAQQLRERVRPDMITLGSLSLQQVRATKKNICVIIPYSPAHQPCPLCCVSVALANGHCVHVCVFVCVRLSILSVFVYVGVLRTRRNTSVFILPYLFGFLCPQPFFPHHRYLYKSSALHVQCR